MLRLPSATCRSTSSSRAVSGSSPMCSASRAATAGGMRLRPAWTWRIASTQLLGRHGLQQVAARAGLERALDLDVALERGEHEDARLGELRADRAQRLDPVHVRQPQVQQRDVRPVSAELLEALAAAGRLRDQRHVRLAPTSAAIPWRSSGWSSTHRTRIGALGRHHRSPFSTSAPPRRPDAMPGQPQPPPAGRSRVGHASRAPPARPRCRRRARSTAAAGRRSPRRARACPESPQCPSRPTRRTSGSTPAPSSRTSSRTRARSVLQLHLDLRGPRVAERVDQRLAADPVELVAHRGMQRPGVPFTMTRSAAGDAPASSAPDAREAPARGRRRRAPRSAARAPRCGPPRSPAP